MKEQRWQFSPMVDYERAERLLAIENFHEVIDLVSMGRITGFDEEARSSDPENSCVRASFSVEVSESAFDAFFNAPQGYRGQYCESEENGENCNAQLLRALAWKCCDFLDFSGMEGMQENVVRASLAGEDAKIWVFERDMDLVERVPKILYQPWLDRALAVGDDAHSAQSRALAMLGVSVPLGTRLSVKGSWIQPDGGQWRDPSKANRAKEIAECGFTKMKPGLEQRLRHRFRV